MEKIILEGITLEFNDFSQQVQEKLYLQAKEKFKKDATNSKFSKIRILVVEDEGSSSEFLHQMLQDEVNNYKDSDVIKAILNNPNFKMDDASRKLLAESEDWEYRQIAAKDEGSSLEFLENMYLKEKDRDVFEALEQNILRKYNNVSNKLNIVQKHKIIKLLRKFKNSNISVSEVINQIAAIIA